MVYKKEILLRIGEMKKYLVIILMAFVGFSAMAQDEDENGGENTVAPACVINGVMIVLKLQNNYLYSISITKRKNMWKHFHTGSIFL